VKETEAQVDSAEKIRIHQYLVNRIISRAQIEGTPLKPIEIQQFESDRMLKDEYRKFDKEFTRETNWQDFLDRISGILRRAIAEDAANDPTIPAQYKEMVNKLEDCDASFTLWACCVPALSEDWSKLSWKVHGVALLIVVLAVIFGILLYCLKIL
jgi:hypothetical protein